MYEAGPQVLSPVRKPNQVDTVTWDVTREFLHPLASLPFSLLRVLLPLPSHPLPPSNTRPRPSIPTSASPKGDTEIVHPSRAILRTLRPAYLRNDEAIFLPICLSFHRSRKASSFEKIDKHASGKNNTMGALLCAR